MSTGYRLEVGYLSGGNRADAWADLKAVALDICEHSNRIYDEVERVEGARGVALDEYVVAYRDRDDLTITFHETPNHFETPEDFRPYIYQMASGGGAGRELKEACRRAFCRLVIETMHRKRIEVNMIVS